MNILQSILNTYKQKDEAWEKKNKYLQNRINIRKKQIERLEKKANLHWKKFPRIITEIIEPICDEIIKYFPDTYYNDIHSLGTCSRMPVFFCKIGENGYFAYIEFTAGVDNGNVELFVTDIYTDTGEFSKGSIGEINGMNHPNIHVPKDADIQWFIDFIGETNKKEIKS